MIILALAMILFYYMVHSTLTAEFDENQKVSKTEESKECQQVRAIIKKKADDIHNLMLYNQIYALKEHTVEPNKPRNNVYLDVEENDINDILVNLIGEAFKTKVSRMSTINQGEYPIHNGYLINGMDKDIHDFFYTTEND